jgi:MoaA/NifB/PqqE/SkfB family radical SAM enzyme
MTKPRALPALRDADHAGDALPTAASLLGTRLAALSPRKLIVNLTYVCNNHCAMCAVGDRPARHMDAERCAELLVEYFARGARLLDYDGGEPTLHPHLLRLVRLAKETGYERVNVTTNGRRLAARDFASRLLLSGIDSLLVSLYAADAERHDGMTGTPGSFAETVAGIRHAVRLRPRRVALGINTLVGRRNWDALRALARFVVELGVERLNVQFPTPFGRAASAHLAPWAEALNEVRATLDELGGRLDIAVVNLPPCRLPGHETTALADAEKYSRVMAFVDTPPENLAEYLSRRRTRRRECTGCAYSVVCEGDYEFDEQPSEGTRRTEADGR